MQKHARHVVAEICQPDHPVCPWAGKLPMRDAMQDARPAYLGFDVSSLIPSGKHAGHSCLAGRKNESGVPFLSLADCKFIPLKNASLSEFYFSVVTSNIHIPLKSVPWLVSEAARVIMPGGRLVLYNGYCVSHRAFFVDFTRQTPSAFFSDMDTELLRALYTLQSLFKPLDLEGHKRFLEERKPVPMYELKPGRDISVLVRNQA